MAPEVPEHEGLETGERFGQPVLMEFDRILAKAAAPKKAKPLRESLSPQEIEHIAQYHYASMLAADDMALQEAPEEETLRRSVLKQMSD